MKRGELCEYPSHPSTSIERTRLNQSVPLPTAARVSRGICGIQALTVELKHNLL